MPAAEPETTMARADPRRRPVRLPGRDHVIAAPETQVILGHARQRGMCRAEGKRHGRFLLRQLQAEQAGGPGFLFEHQQPPAVGQQLVQPGLLRRDVAECQRRPAWRRTPSARLRGLRSAGQCLSSEGTSITAKPCSWKSLFASPRGSNRPKTAPPADRRRRGHTL